jgi:hypothetical protein
LGFNSRLFVLDFKSISPEIVGKGDSIVVLGMISEVVIGSSLVFDGILIEARLFS